MAKDAKKKDPEFRTPRWVWDYPKIDKADYGTKEFPKPAGEYSVQARAKADDELTKKFIEQLQPLFDEAIELGNAAFKELKVDARKKLEKQNGKGGIKVNDLFTTLYDQETEEPTGEIKFKFSMAASGKFKDKGTGKEKTWTAKPRIFDGKGQPITKVPEIWGGSEGIVAFSARPYFIPGTGAVGLKLKLLAAQLCKLVQGGGRDASGYGFGQEEGGYEHSDSIGDDEDETSKKSGDEDSEDQTSGTDEETSGDEDF
jgi:hypothetical protein